MKPDKETRRPGDQEKRSYSPGLPVSLSPCPASSAPGPARLSYAHGACATPLLGQTIGDNLRATVERHGDREALVVRQQKYRATYRQFWDLAGRLARGLLALGVQKGDRVGIWSPNRFEWPAVQYATARVGAILVNLN